MLEHLNFMAVKPSRVVIMGAGGFVGSAAAKNLHNKNIKTLELTRQQVDLLQDDAADKLAAFIQPNDCLLIISAIAPCKNNEQLVQNLQMMQQVCKAIKNKSEQLSHVVYISSDAVYADDVSLATENSTMQPNSLHGMMHAARELMLKTTVGSIPLAILRPSVLYGANDPHNGYGPNRFLRLAKANTNITLFGGGEEKRDHIYIEDVAEIIALTLLHRSKGLLNIATGNSSAFSDIAKIIVDAINSQVTVQLTPRQTPITHRHFDINACMIAFPHFKYKSFNEGLACVLEEQELHCEL